jgi:hypothetical protein
MTNLVQIYEFYFTYINLSIHTLIFIDQALDKTCNFHSAVSEAQGLSNGEGSSADRTAVQSHKAAAR